MLCQKYTLYWFLMENNLHVSRVIAHRGAPSSAPENTIAGLHQAHALGAEWVEFDLRLTRDGRVIVMHDATVERTTNGVGRIDEMDFAEIAQLDAGNGQQVPLFERWVAVALSLGLKMNLEIKTSKHEASTMVEKVHAILQRLWSQDLTKPIISADNQRFLELYRDIDPNAQLAFVTNGMPFRWRKRLNQMGVMALVISRRRINHARVEALHEAGYQVMAYTVDSLAEAEMLFEMGVDSIFTDNLTVMAPLLNSTAS